MSFPISKLLDVDDFKDRWKRARLAAIKRYINSDLSDDNESFEESLLNSVDQDLEPQLFRTVFENSKKLGESARWYFGAEWEISDVCEIFSELGIACLTGAWNSQNGGIVLERPGCVVGDLCGRRGCDFYKEAIDGLILGLSDDILFSRQESIGHGSTRCRDCFLRGDARHLAFGPLPAGLIEILSDVKEELMLEGISVEFPGQCEGVVYYSWQIAGGSSCRDASPLVAQKVLAAVRRADLTLSTKDVTPRAIIGPGSTDNDKQAQITNLVTISKGRKKQWNQILK